MGKRISGWSAGAIGLIVFFTVLLILKWKSFPIFFDLYYHAGCMMGFDQAGGVSLYDFWEYVPIGRPHLYPPFLHVLMLGLYRIGMSPLFIMRLISVAIYPSVLVTVWWVVRRIYSGREAFFTVVAITIPYTFFLSTVNAVPASLALMILMLLLYAVEKEKMLCGVLLLGLSFYVHGALPWVAVLFLLLYSLLNRKNIRFISVMILGGVLLGSPWLIHIMRYREYFLLAFTRENLYFEGNLLIYIFAVFGILTAIRRKGRYYFSIALLLAMTPLAIKYRYRFLCGQGLLPMGLLAGIALDGFYGKAKLFFERHFNRPAYIMLLPALIFFVLMFFSPVVFFAGGNVSFRARNTTFTNLIPGYDTGADLRSQGATIYNETFTGELVDIIRANTREDDIVYCNYNYVGGMLSVLSGRVISCGMLNEVRPPRFDPFQPAALIVWIKRSDGSFNPFLGSLIEQLDLEKAGETDIAYVYKNPSPGALRKTGEAVLPTRWAFLILFVWMGLLAWSLAREHGRDP